MNLTGTLCRRPPSSPPGPPAGSSGPKGGQYNGRSYSQRGINTEAPVEGYCNTYRGSHALIAAGSEGAVLHGNLEHEYRRATINTFGGGVVEVLRGLVATHGLGMPSHR